MNTGIVYTRGTQILASLGRGAPIGAAHARGPAVRDPKYATTAAAMLYPRPGGDPRARPKSPVVGKNSPRQYEAASHAGRPPAQPRRLRGAAGAGHADRAGAVLAAAGPAAGRRRLRRRTRRPSPAA